MPHTIGNPVSWAARSLSGTATTLGDSTRHIGHATPATAEVRTITMADLRAALSAGIEDFAAVRADVLFLVLLYPVIGLVLAGFGLNAALTPLLFPLTAGFALVGPVAAVGLYEISRRRERGEAANWASAFAVARNPAFGAIVVLGLYLAALFFVWILAAHGIWLATLGPEAPASLMTFAAQVVSTPAGWEMAISGIVVGFVFAVIALSISLVSFPMLLDRDCGVPSAVITSVRVVRKNPRVALAWGAIVAGGLVLGSLPLFIGLMIVLPVLGHATWHLYRRAVV